VVAAKQVPGLYHSLALLLPDGRVVTTPGRWAENPNEEGREVQFYTPDYLLRGPRPSISSAPTTVGYGASFFVGTPDAGRIARVTWLRLPSVTHGFDQNQRMNRLGFTGASGGLNVITPYSRNLCPPGHYLLFLLDAQGVPSVARIIQIL
jgi:galactose oxidase